MLPLLFGLLVLGVLIWAIRLKIPQAKQNVVDDVKQELTDTKQQSEVLDVKEQIVDEKLDQRKRKTKLNTKEEKLND